MNRNNWDRLDQPRNNCKFSFSLAGLAEVSVLSSSEGVGKSGGDNIISNFLPGGADAAWQFEALRMLKANAKAVQLKVMGRVNY